MSTGVEWGGDYIMNPIKFRINEKRIAFLRIVNYTECKVTHCKKKNHHGKTSESVSWNVMNKFGDPGLSNQWEAPDAE